MGNRVRRLDPRGGSEDPDWECRDTIGYRPKEVACLSSQGEKSWTRCGLAVKSLHRENWVAGYLPKRMSENFV